MPLISAIAISLLTILGAAGETGSTTTRRRRRRCTRA